ncbi:Growth inhibition and differentiation-related protein 88 [Rhynchospora pubera]|uniref:Growth inhibition and differentiation-related protein 88 n=1 Tax=Rhynchospora pubera TaxID=906938 RepID=A0AAV8BZG1_9POAL|nr:Growth inhibition and differentiation-related protein 88 [Rhynchospora pubera]
MEASKEKQDQEPKTLMPGDDKSHNWSEHVENLLDGGDTDGAISFLETFISRRDGGSSSSSSTSTADLQLAAAMGDLADLYSSRGDSIKADELRSRAISIRVRRSEESSTSVSSNNLRVAGPSTTTIPLKEKDTEEPMLLTTLNNDVEDGEDDWETAADRIVDDTNLLSLKPNAETSLAESGNLEQKQKEKSTTSSEKMPRRKGRGSFLYGKSMLYSDTQGELEEASGSRLDALSNQERKNEEILGRRHVLVLYDLPKGTRTTELEKMFQEFDDTSFAIRWVNETSALAVFPNPSLADSAKKCITSRYKVRALHDGDELLSQLKTGDLEPPYPRPKTSTSTALRMLAQATGQRFSSPGSGIREHKQQERERKNRIIARQNLRDDAWGSD